MNLEELLSTLESPIVIRPTRRMTQGELESYLDKAADILRVGLKLDGSLKANFVTCYQADNSISKIRTSPVWSRVDCVRQLGGVP